ncbi:acetyl-CoA carboxylase biotin carboxylase subunit [Candidatus Poribacteria bacterium]|nr:acetyl-CoA carboxylase biotin carboxylase subunit [Candidatus Poribacteria bacterium]
MMNESAFRPSFKKVLVANRGEIAIRIIRACQELGIRTVAIYSDADKNSFYYRIADEAHNIKGSSARQTYLNIEKVLDVARKTGCAAVHPGYGFLSENPDFASACNEAGIKFIGPSSACMRKIADKAHIKKTMQVNGIPVLPSIESEADSDRLRILTKEMGFPLIVKPSFGGGGKGMRIVRSGEELEDALRYARAIGKSAFRNEAFYIEKYLEKPRHVEVQILADSDGKIIALGERECSIQRSHQKLIEESPSPALTPEKRNEVIELAKKAAAVVEYENAGTIEFLYYDGRFYFLEVNGRIQVEHSVTELVTGMDLVKEQIRIACGGKIEESMQDIPADGWAIQCRINAEDPYNQFAPSPGTITGYRAPGGMGVRVDTGIFMGYTIPTQYDSLVSKLSVWGRDRTEAVSRMRRVLSEYVILGIRTLLPLHRAIFREKNFLNGDYTTNYVEEHLEDLLESMKQIEKSEKSHDELLAEVFTSVCRLVLNENHARNSKATSGVAPFPEGSHAEVSEEETIAVIAAAIAVAMESEGTPIRSLAQRSATVNTWATIGRIAQMNQRLPCLQRQR